MLLNKTSEIIKRGVTPPVRVLNYIGAGILVIMMVLVTVDVCLRYLFSQPISGAYELVVFMLCVLVFTQLPHTTLVKGHVNVDFVAARLPKRVQSAFSSFVTLISMGLMGLIAWRTLIYANALKSGGQASDVLHIPDYPFVLVVFAGSIVVTAILLIEFMENLAKAFKK